MGGLYVLHEKMSPRTINAIRDLALSYEEKDIQVSYDLMQLAYENRPEGPFIKKKYFFYKQRLDRSFEDLSKLVKSNKIAIIPIGFRCHTANIIKKMLGLSLPSYPFTSGFFSPDSVTSVLKNNKVNLRYNDDGKTHSVCMKTEGYEDSKYGRGIQFLKTSYNNINSLVKTKDQKNINTLLDTTFGYYTLDENHKFILAHYNWHSFATKEKSKGVIDPAENLNIINEMLNRRISRMMDLCDKVDHIFFIFSENQNYNYLKIDDEYFNLDDFERLDNFCRSKYGEKYFRLNTNEINSPETILRLCRTSGWTQPLASGESS